MYLVDTCVWIDFLRNKENNYVRLLEELLKSGDAFVNEIIISEICYGASSKRQFDNYYNHFAALPIKSLPTNWPTHLAHMGYKLRSSGFKPFIADLLIALSAINANLVLLTKDKDFEPMEKIFKLKVKYL